MEKDVPYIVYESEAARHERTVKRLVIALVIAVALIFVSNIAWLVFFNQFEFATNEITVDSQDAGNASYIGSDGVIDNGRGKSQTTNNDSQE